MKLKLTRAKGTHPSHSHEHQPPILGKIEVGGVSLFIRNNIIHKKRVDLSMVTPFLELLFVEIMLNGKTYLIGVAYRPPNSNIKLFIDELNKILEPLKNKSQIVLMGDFNLCLLQDNNNNNLFKNIMQSNLLFPTILEPTRVNALTLNEQNTITESLIDNIFVNESLSYYSGLIYSDISDHYPIFISIPRTLSYIHDNKLEVKYRIIDEFKIRKFKYSINNHPTIRSLEYESSAKIAFTTFFKIFIDQYNKYFPIKSKKVTNKRLRKPWISDTFIEQINYKHELAKLVDKGRIDKKTYTDFRNRLTKDLREAKLKYYDTEFTKNSGNIKGTWKIINKNIKNQFKSKKLIIKENDIILNDKDVPSKFIEYFTNIPHSLVNKIKPARSSSSSFLKSQFSTFFMRPVIDKDIETAIKSLKSSNGVYTISTIVLKEVMSDISEPLSNIFNLCILQGYFPTELKTGCITPIFKKGDQYSIENYRPVCSVSQFSKIFEKIVFTQMTDFINKNSIISKSQYGFQANKSTEAALVNFVDYIHKGLTDKSNVGAIFMDLSKAFDVMSHNILKSKLNHYGFRGNFLEFIMDFLRDRKYFVSVNGYSSDTRTSNIGVPQGSTLGPLLFLLYVNDITNSSDILKFIIFADDTTVLYENSNIVMLNSIITEEVNKVIDWFSANKLLINLTKTNTMLFSFKNGNPRLHITINSILLEEKQAVTFL